MFGVVSVSLVVNLVGVFHFYRGNERAAVGWLFLGGLFFGAAIMLIAQIYHINAHFPNGILWWALGVLPFAMFLQSRVLFYLVSGLSLVWFFVEAAHDFFPWLFILFVGALAWFVVKGRSLSYVLFLCLVFSVGVFLESILAWFVRPSVGFDLTPEHVALTASFMVAFYGVSKWLGASSRSLWIDYGALLNVWVIRFAILFMLIMSFSEPWQELIEVRWDFPLGIILVSVLFCLLGVGLAFFSHRQSFSQVFSVVAFSVFLLICLPMVVFMGDSVGALFFQGVDNLVLLGTGIWLINKGIRQGISHYYFLGIVSIMLLALLRYIDLIGDYVGATVLFVVFGGVLIGVASFWRKYGGQHESSV